MHRPIELPAPAPEAIEHSRRLATHIAARIQAAGGWIDFAEYMDLALYAPGLGYYSAGATKFGPEGDFVTAPEISPLFARCLANACVPWLRGSPGAAILELGAGSGLLAAGLLAALDRHGALPANYLILEVSAELRERQRRALGRLPRPLFDTVQWLDTLPATSRPLIVLANEVADALPVSRFTRVGGKIHAQGVALGERGFSWSLRPASGELGAAVVALETSLGRTLPDGYRSEISLRLPAWISAVAAVIREGFFLLCDYGMARREYYHEERRDGTLMCHYRHRAHDDPFFYPGLQDITAWVDFTAVAQAATAAGLELQGYGTQAHFLLDTGIDAELAGMMAGGGRAAVQLARQARTLLLPGEMGERFKVMALARGNAAMRGFGFRDLRHLL